MTTGGNETEPEALAERQLRHEIEHTREQLGETVEQLAAKADVGARARARITELTRHAPPWQVPLAAAAGAVILALLVLRKGTRPA